MLKDILDKNQCFKLVCGAGNEDCKEVENLVALYSLAGCNFFDVCAKPEIVKSARKGLTKAGNLSDRYLCVSVGISGDPHISKAQINKDICIECNSCKPICPREAINPPVVDQKRCIGCSRCVEICPKNAISMIEFAPNYSEILPEIISLGIDCIEFHAICDDENKVLGVWDELNNIFNGMLCISVDRSTLGDKKLVELIKAMVNLRKPYSTIIQADGVAMSGNNDEYGTTLQAVATAQMFQNAKLSAYIMMSGGTNTKSTQLAKMVGVKPNALAVGSYARKIVQDYLKDENLFDKPEKLSEAVKIAKNLIDVSLENMKND